MSESKQRLQRENDVLRGEVEHLRDVIVRLARGDQMAVVEAQLIVRGASLLHVKPQRPEPKPLSPTLLAAIALATTP